MPQPCDLFIHSVQLASMQDNGVPYGIIENAAIAVCDGKIAYAGPMDECNYSSENKVDGQGKWCIPGLIDCHTHLVYGGNRAQEFEQRLQGVSYADIAKQGGGIQSTVNATRATCEQDLFDSAKCRVLRLLEEGVTTVEIKSGYGLNVETEKKMLRVARAIGEQLPITISTTFLGAHAVPKEASSAECYIDLVCKEMMPALHKEGLIDAVDVFCEHIGFSPEQCRKVFQAAQGLNLPIKAHVEQLSDLKGACLAAEFKANSVEHIEYLAEDDVPKLKTADTVAVLLPGAFYSLNETQKPPIHALRQHRVPMAVATDCNPGSSPVASLLTSMNMACVLFSLTPEEALKGTTVHAAKALGLTHKGQIKAGMDADFSLWIFQHPCELAYGINMHRPERIWVGGNRVQF
ncbi:imidazolonepropionase [Marinibactrum halimedae]|uniref:Imidazolonepropionase n=1 Tax=Marinibactrum halimedae TaxID=1444977 RepID=A0AA37WMY0_9GAMM|nr:imidazolonepropionase [Marinibactrum halimedae]MCD9459362.1 imidazolonepropionase [Marinibactrum halimedae]GLS27574.1 imidazolonepropionase [Marinibactrum halimedae]